MTREFPPACSCRSIRRPPVGTTDAALGLIANDFIIQGTVNPASQQLAGTPYTDYSTDPAQVDFIAPEPTGFVVVGGLFGLWAIGSATYRRMRKPSGLVRGS